MRPVLVRTQTHQLGPDGLVDVHPDGRRAALEQLLDQVVSVPASADDPKSAEDLVTRKARRGKDVRSLRETQDLTEDRIVHHSLHGLASQLLDLALPNPSKIAHLSVSNPSPSSAEEKRDEEWVDER